MFSDNVFSDNVSSDKIKKMPKSDNVFSDNVFSDKIKKMSKSDLHLFLKKRNEETNKIYGIIKNPFINFFKRIFRFLFCKPEPKPEPENRKNEIKKMSKSDFDLFLKKRNEETNKIYDEKFTYDTMLDLNLKLFKDCDLCDRKKHYLCFDCYKEFQKFSSNYQILNNKFNKRELDFYYSNV